jgi:hypothetical protein
LIKLDEQRRLIGHNSIAYVTTPGLGPTARTSVDDVDKTLLKLGLRKKSDVDRAV